VRVKVLTCHRIKTAEGLSAAGVPSTVILDSAVAYVMDKVDFVLVGSEAVVESGGLVNAVGSNQIAIIARAANKPFYALAERFAPVRLAPSIKIDWCAPLTATNFIVCFRYHNTIFPATIRKFYRFPVFPGLSLPFRIATRPSNLRLSPLLRRHTQGTRVQIPTPL